MTGRNVTPAEKLAMVDAGIEAVIMGGQSYRIGPRTLTRADLSMLRALRKELQAQVDAETSGGDGLLSNTAVAYFDRR
jgi:hypothetical protein